MQIADQLSGYPLEDQINCLMQVIGNNFGGIVGPCRVMIAMAAMYARSLSPEQRREVIDMLLLQAESLARTSH